MTLDIVKRKIEYEKNGVQLINDGKIYKVKITLKMIQTGVNQKKVGDKEGGFVLDCLNKNKSTMKQYVPLFDYHLKGLFSNKYFRKDLKNKGFINTEGFIMYDPVYRKVMVTQINNIKNNNNNLSKKVIKTINNLDIPSRIEDKEIDTSKEVEKSLPSTRRKIIFDKNPNESKNKKKYDVKKYFTKGNNSLENNDLDNNDNEDCIIDSDFDAGSGEDDKATMSN